MILLIGGAAVLLGFRFFWRILKWELEWTLELFEVMVLLFAGGVLVGIAIVELHP
ncbi:MAG: hypothetical protein PHT60_16415 [Acidiphilium sp.]|nr:hypothetical protein [Acidiphilium sp.]MDD4937348.1 hypothetical protein [Acidiphilium sp.]